MSEKKRQLENSEYEGHIKNTERLSRLERRTQKKDAILRTLTAAISVVEGQAQKELHRDRDISRGEEYGFAYGSIGGENETDLNIRLNADAKRIISFGQINNCLGAGNTEPFQRSAVDLFAELYPSFVSDSFVSDSFSMNVNAIKHDIVKATLYVTAVLSGEFDSVYAEIPKIGRFMVPLKAILESYRGDPDGSDLFESDSSIPITYFTAKAASPSSTVLSVPTRIVRQIEEWKNYIEDGEEEERMPSIDGITNLLTGEIVCHFYLTRHLFYWPIKTSVPMVVFTGIGGAGALPEFKAIIENDVYPEFTQITLPYIVSTTYDLDVAKRFSGSNRNILCILIEAGQSLPVVSGATSQGTEREILMNNGSVLTKVADSKDVEGYTYFFYRRENEELGYLPTREQVIAKIPEAAAVWAKRLGLTDLGSSKPAAAILTQEVEDDDLGGRKTRSKRNKRPNHKKTINRKNKSKRKSKKKKRNMKRRKTYKK